MTDKPEKGDLPPEDSKKPRKKKAEPSAPSPTQSSGSKTKIITWDCQDGCGNVNTRRISIKKIVNDDVCDYCGKRYHEPYTISVVDTKDKKPAKPADSGSVSSKPKLPRKKKGKKPDNDKTKDKEQEQEEE
jgi:hypothetical protein